MEGQLHVLSAQRPKHDKFRAFRKIAASLSVAACAMTGMIAVASPAGAAETESSAAEVFSKLDSSADPAKAYEALSAEDRAAFDNFFLPAKAEETYQLTKLDPLGNKVGETKNFASADKAMSAVAAASSCWTGRSKYTMKAALGNALWDTWTEGTWCGSGGKVTSARFDRTWATIAAVGWRDGGQIGKGSGVAGNQARIWGQRKMILGVGGWDVQTQQPCNRLNGTATGGAGQSWVCSIV